MSPAAEQSSAVYETLSHTHTDPHDNLGLQQGSHHYYSSKLQMRKQILTEVTLALGKLASKWQSQNLNPGLQILSPMLESNYKCILFP